MPTHLPSPPGPTAPAPTPRILLVATLRWPIAARLAMAFAQLGCAVDVLCPRQHPATFTAAVRCVHRHSTWRPMAALRAAIASGAPDLVIPCDDGAALQLDRLHECNVSTTTKDAALHALLVRSLGTPQACGIATQRGRLIGLAADAGVRVPPTGVVPSDDELRAWLARHGLPAVLKTDGSWGGQGVAVVATLPDALQAFESLARGPSLRQALLRALVDRDRSLLHIRLAPARRSVSVQGFIDGVPANRAVACWNGRVLAGISVAAVCTQHPSGPATVVRVIDHAEMSEAAGRLVERLGLSGLWGLDFMLEASTGQAHLIEANPRATPVCHLPLGAGHDLPAALCAAWSGIAVAPRPPIEAEFIALFPGEWQRDPASTHLHEHHHDVPWSQPALVRDGIARPWAERGWIARARAAMRRRAREPVFDTEQTLPAAQPTRAACP